MPICFWWIALSFALYIPLTVLAPLLSFATPQVFKWHTLLIHAGFVGLMAEATISSQNRNWLWVAIGWFIFCGLDQTVSQQALDSFEANVKAMNAKTVQFDPATNDLVVGREPSGEGRQIAARLVAGYKIPQVFDLPDPAKPATAQAFRVHECDPYQRCLEFLKSRETPATRGGQPNTRCYNHYCLYQDIEPPQASHLRIDATRELSWFFNSKMVRITITGPDKKTSEFVWGLAAPRRWFPMFNMACWKDRGRRSCDTFKSIDDLYFPPPGPRQNRRASGDNLYTFIARAIELEPQLGRKL